jgi:hypothetical protein
VTNERENAHCRMFHRWGSWSQYETMINFPRDRYRFVSRDGDTYSWERNVTGVNVQHNCTDLHHDPRCDRDLCHPDCGVRIVREENDQPYPGKKIYR